MYKIYKISSSKHPYCYVSFTTTHYLSKVLAKLKYNYKKGTLRNPSLIGLFSNENSKVRITLIREVDTEEEIKNVFDTLTIKNKIIDFGEPSVLKYGVSRKDNISLYNKIRYNHLKAKKQETATRDIFEDENTFELYYGTDRAIEEMIVRNNTFGL